MLTLGYNCKCVKEHELLLNRKKIEFSSYLYLFAATIPTTTVTTTTPGEKLKAADYNSYCYYYHTSSASINNDSILALSKMQQVNDISCFGAYCMQEEGVYNA